MANQKGEKGVIFTFSTGKTEAVAEAKVKTFNLVIAFFMPPTRKDDIWCLACQYVSFLFKINSKLYDSCTVKVRVDLWRGWSKV